MPWALVVRFGVWLLGSFIGRILVGAGLALVGNFTFGKFVDYFIAKAITTLNAIPMVGLLGVAGIDKAISILITGIMIKVMLASSTQGLKLAKAKK